MSSMCLTSFYLHQREFYFKFDENLCELTQLVSVCEKIIFDIEKLSAGRSLKERKNVKARHSNKKSLINPNEVVGAACGLAESLELMEKISFFDK